MSAHNETNQRGGLTPELVAVLTESQSRLRGFLIKRLGNPDSAHEVLQEVNLVICRRCYEFRSSGERLDDEFLAWAFTIARIQIMAFHKRRARDRMVFPQDLSELVATMDDSLLATDLTLSREAALKKCIAKLSISNRRLVTQRYAEMLSAKAIAAEMGRSTNAVNILLHRIREQLMQCIQQRLVGEIGDDN
jgi:RNA polymerase sigma-70 factor (ECF subfamily)